MKPVYLEFNGINSFSEPARIQFNALLAGGVFGIFGDTGSGKSTILDSIHFALYGEVDRVPKSFNDCINYRSDSAKVTFDFEITHEGKRKTYRVQRERKRKTGGTKAYLYEYTDDKTSMLALAEGTREVDEKIEEIIGLSFADFKMCIALPQGDFAALVKSTTAERVKLVSRLFNLEKYGERLSKAVNERFYRAEEEVNLIKAKMGENEGGDEQTLALLVSRIDEAKQTLERAQTNVKQAEERLMAAEETERKKQAFDTLTKRLQTLDMQLPKMQENQRLLTAAPGAQSVAEKYAAMQTSAKDETLAKQTMLQAQTQHGQVTKQLENKKKEIEEQAYPQKILSLSVRLERIRAAATDVQAAKTAENALQACIAEYKRLEASCPKEDFASLRAQIDAQRAALGEDDTFLSYLQRNAKAVLLQETYTEIQADLRALAGKYPLAEKDIAALVAKYTPTVQTDGQSFDVTALQEQFRRMEEQRKVLRQRADELEKRRLRYEENESKKTMLVEQGKLLRENYQTAQAKIAEVKDLGTEESAQQQIIALQKAEASAKAEIERLQQRLQELYAEIQKQNGLLSTHAAARETHEQALTAALQAGGFANIQEATSILQRLGDVQAAQANTQAFFEEYTRLQADYQQADQAALAAYNAEELPLSRSLKQQAQAALNEANQTLGALENERVRLVKLREKYQEQVKELTTKEAHKNLCDELRLLVRSNRFLEFIASEYLQEISQVASKTLLSLTGGRYFLKYDKEFKVGDNLDGGNVRAVKTLSGGETFLVSLSLALSLSATICAKSLRPIEFFFLDEGFGTLDGKLVDTVMDVLGKLSKTFAVGLISHVDELKHRIENKIVVTGATETHGSQVKVEIY